MLDQVSGAGSPAATAGWGAGLTVGGLVLAAGAIGFMMDYQGWPSRYVESVTEQRRQLLPFLPIRPATARQVRQARYAIGAAMLFMALVAMVLGVFEFTQL